MDAEIIVEMLSRIKALERDVAELKQKIADGENETVPSPETARRITYKVGCRPLREFEEDGMPLVPERKRDTTRYVFEGSSYPKNRLVYAVVKRYVIDHPEISCTELRLVFDKSLQGSLGVVEKVEIAKQRGDEEYHRRFFAERNEILHLRDGDMVVCTQWGILNIPRFLTVARQLGYQIEEIPQ